MGFNSAFKGLTVSMERYNCQLQYSNVIFQGRPVVFNQLISAESMTGSFSLADLLQLRIGEEPVPSACSGYNEKYYIDRTFNRIIITQDIAIDKREGKFADLLANTEKEFKQLCQ